MTTSRRYLVGFTSLRFHQVWVEAESPEDALMNAEYLWLEHEGKFTILSEEIRAVGILDPESMPKTEK